MIKIEKKKIKDQFVVSELLKKSREELGLRIVDVEKRIGVAKKYINALENNDFCQLPAKIYCIHFVRKYAQFLNLDVDDILETFKKEYTVFKKTQGMYNPSLKKNKKSLTFFELLVVPKLLRSVMIGVVGLCFLVYLFFGVRNIFAKPLLKIHSPENNVTVNESIVELSGTIDENAQVFINDQEILTTIDGEFETILNLNKGVNIIEVKAINKHGVENVELRKILVEDSKSVEADVLYNNFDNQSL